ncbi:MAG: S8 family peptidase [Isosphaeraceae bacterium]
MPHHPEDDRYLHLPLIREEPNPQRRRRRGFPQDMPDRGGRGTYGPAIRTRVEQLEQQARARPQPPPGVQPHLVFRVPLAAGASSTNLVQLLEEAGITIVGIERDGAIIAFRDDVNLDRFRQALDEYTRGPRINPQTDRPYDSTKWDVFELIEAAQMRLWSRPDRVGRRLADTTGQEGRNLEPSRIYILDVELWHRGTPGLARQAINELRALLDDAPPPGERLSDEFTGETLCLARVSLTGAKLDRLLEMDIVAEVDLPPVPVFDSRTAQKTTRYDFPSPPRPPTGGPSVCTLDSGVASNNPLIANNIGHTEAILTQEESAADAHGHGTMVGGLAVFGDVRACFQAGHFASDITLYSARVLNDENRFDDEKLIIQQMRRAIEVFKTPPYNCRVFNLSLGDDRPWLRDNARQSLWAECLDVLAREQKVLLVVSAGNQPLGIGDNARDAEGVLARYPDYLFEPDCGLCDPATAAIALTVGGIAQHDEPEVRRGNREESIVRTVANCGEPLPTTRIGPGLDSAIKPEFVAYAGNWTFDGFGSTYRTIRDDPGVAVMSLSREPTQSLFSFDVGTSFAAPLVARLGAMVWDRLREALGEEPDPNLVRAVLATAAAVPDALREKIEPLRGADGVLSVCGYGMLDEDHALHSGDRRVTLVAQSSIFVDSFQLYEVPVPEEFRRAPGKKRVCVALAFDPPVRRRRAQYLGVAMSYALIRGKSVDDIVEAYRALTADEQPAVRRGEITMPGALQSPYRCDLRPGPQALESSTLQRSEWTFQREQQNYGESWYLLVRATRIWAPADVTAQDFGVAVCLEAEEPRLYSLVRQRVQVRVQPRARV